MNSYMPATLLLALFERNWDSYGDMTVRRYCRHFLHCMRVITHHTYLGHCLVGESNVIDWNRVSPREVLAGPREEGLGKEESRYPKHWGWFVHQPSAVMAPRSAMG